MMNIPIHFKHDWLPTLEQKIKDDGPWDKLDFFQLALQAEQSLMIPDFDSLVCLDHLPTLTPYPHQVEAAKKVITEMHGRAILADEVGLGKTIEAGLILKEYMVRGLVKKALILVPASLVIQWTKELTQKLAIPAVAQKKEYMWKECDILVASIDTAKRPPHRNHVLEQEYDMVIVDEAHKLKNPKSKNYEFMLQLKKKYCLLLTATPVQNEISELFHLVSLLRPGVLGDAQAFQKHYVKGKRQTKNNDKLQALLSKVMIRNMRKDGSVHFTKRHVHNIYLDLSPEEKALYDAVTRFVQEHYQQEFGLANIFSLITLQKEVCSSKEATFLTLYNMFQKCGEHSPLRPKIWDLLSLIKKIEHHTKALKTMELIKDIGDKVIVFTEYRATQDYLQRILYEHGITSVPFRGGFRRNKKDWMTELFEKRAQVLIATEAGGEGINLQFCNHIINYDLPWNPMRVEQRIGRVHRLGQKRDVYIYNLTTKGTIEAYILHLLYEKINLFEMVIGELDQIIDHLELNQSIEENLTDIVLKSGSTREMEIKLENLSYYIQSVQNNIKNQAQWEMKQEESV
ncbi:DEAD/DEAH box helicase [Caldalkalibacillus thermarum TA2.A1]|uniref:DEAD/DEAH box helicase n=2 Tax=Caldalkalibacillus thermarum (strain TA2.A1) TaxID=986075 RepID=A0A8X8LBW4_CALTT|nr:SNF2-related protein [Caldalkalibacillus thermarum]QZT35388.1 DEAD/DEAH box helicase [Caldalkalibacillus thermarum TA2.A1]